MRLPDFDGATRYTPRMSWINASLLVGLGLSALPIILHLVMRAKPKRIEFPALRLLKARQPSNARRMQLRHWLLLLLRMLLIAAIVLAIARPSLPAASYGLRWWEWLLLIVTAAAAWAVHHYWIGREATSDSVKSREQRGQKRLWILLGGALAALLTVGVPWGLRVRAELAAPRNEATENIPVAAVFLVDTSLSMNYRHENLTRLELARRVISEHVERLPSGSTVAVAGLDADEDIVFQADASGAASRLETLESTAVPEPWNRRIRAAIQLQTDDRERTREQFGTASGGDLFAREIYVVTDFSRTGWQDPDEAGLLDAMKVADWLQVYFVDVSVLQPANLSLSGLTLSDESTVAGGSVQLTVNVSATAGLGAGTVLETVLIDPEGKQVRNGAPLTVDASGGTSQLIATVRVPAGQRWAEGIVRIIADDPLADDNARFFSCGVRDRPRVLLIADQPTEVSYLRNALQPELSERQGVKLCDVTVKATAQTGGLVFTDYDAVFLVNCQRPDDALWSGLKSFAQSGGGVFVVAGSNRVDPSAWMTKAALELLPAAPIRAVKFLSEPAQLTIESDQHPIAREFVQDSDARVELSTRAFDRCWAVEPVTDATVILGFSDESNRPALLERVTGEGRCLLFTSAMDNLPNGGSQWNNLVLSWSFLALSERALQHLTGASAQRRNYRAGELVECPVPPSQRFEQFLLRRPELRQTRGDLPPEDSSLVIADATVPGHYRVKPFESPSPFEAGFAVNCRDEESDLTRIQDDRLQEMFGKDRVAIVHDPAELQRAVKVGRLGVEVFPVLLGLVLMLLAAEHLLANFFYDEPQPAAA